MAKTIYTKGTTPIGEAYFAHLIAPEEYQGKSTNKFTIMLKLSPKDTEDLKAKIDAEWQKYTESEEGQKHKYKYDYVNGVKEYNDTEFFKFKMTHIIKTKRGDWERTVPIFDAACKAFKEPVELGNCSKVRVAYELAPFYVSDKNYGIALRLTGVQVLKLESVDEASADSMGFHQEEGYHVEYSETVPFDEPFDNDEGDF